MAVDDEHSIEGDRALREGDQDRLGFQEVATRISASLVDRASEDGLVVGLEGAWGSGKSSLLYLIDEELKKLPEDRKPSVINFRPWLIGKRDALITALFAELTKELEEIANRSGGVSRVNVDKAKQAADALRRYVVGLSKISSTLQFAGEVSGFGWLTLAAKWLKFSGDAAAKEKTSPSLVELKSTLVKFLRDLKHRFIITIDDVDRLEPSEVMEILRLVRSVVDLPNVIYVLCYDSSILAHSIKEASKVESGQAYLEKIVQLTVMVPTPEPFQLRQWFTDELNLIGVAKDGDEFSRLKDVIDHEGGKRLNTPRSVVRALDAIRFFWPPLRDIKADFADLVWLQLIKDANPKLYRWIEDYCATASVLSLGSMRIEESEKTKQLEALVALCPAGYFDEPIYQFYFAAQLPGVESSYSKVGKPLKIFQHVAAEKRKDSIRRKRLTSPDHYRLYFALSAPSHALRSDQFNDLLNAAEASPTKTGQQLLKLHREPSAGNLSKADLLLERIKDDADSLSETQRVNLLISFSEVMDKAFRLRPFDEFWINSFWYRAELSLKTLLKNLKPASRKLVIKSFDKGEALGWLTSIFRRETFAHGRVTADRKRPESDWIFSNTELDMISKILINRYSKLTSDELFAFPNPVSLLFAWHQGGDPNGPRKLLERNTQSDLSLVRILENMTNTASSSDRGNHQVIQRRTLEPFLDYDKVLERVQTLTKHSDLSGRAKNLLAAFKGDNNLDN